ncbi:MAG TPA: ABC transporter permease [Longimicrobiales bacterium]|nr:ABC transporter permease [Longimicrobiales bacterium]
MRAWMRLPTVLRQLLDDLNRQRLRTLLTVLGITWGTTAVVVLLAFGIGFGNQMRLDAAGMGDGIVLISGNRTTRSFQGFPEKRPIRLTEDDVKLIEREVPGIQVISPEYGSWGRYVHRGGKRTQVYVTGVPVQYEDLRNVFPEAGGRFLDQPDMEQRRRVVMLGNEVKNLLFGDADPIGQQVYIEQTPFTVIGIMRKKTQNSSYNARDQDRVFIPITTYRALYGPRTINWLIYKPEDPTMSPAINTRIREVLGRRYTFDPADRDALGIWDTNEMMRMFKYIFIGFDLFLAVVGSFTLIVGGVGVANIMFVVVQERTREIGIRRSVGARRRDILFQVLLEAVLLVGCGALAGFVISLGITWGASMLPIQEYIGTPTISRGVALLTGLLLTTVALVAGLMPARRAARLDPADALRWNA